MLTLQNVTRENWVACIRLTLHEDQQGYLASNLATIAESKFELHHRLRAIYAGEQLVGMLAYCHENEPEDHELYWLFRLMIDKSHQRRGHANRAIELVSEEVRRLGGQRLRTMHKPSNTAAAALYHQHGFKPIGRLDDGNTLLERSLG